MYCGQIRQHFNLCRCYNDPPAPHPESFFEATQRFMFCIQNSLALGPIRSGKLGIEFRLDIFRYSFKDIGIPTTRGRIQADFSDNYFVGSWYVLYDRFGKGCIIDFPIVVCPKIKCGPKTLTKNSKGTVVESPRMFSEVVRVDLVKSVVEYNYGHNLSSQHAQCDS